MILMTQNPAVTAGTLARVRVRSLPAAAPTGMLIVVESDMEAPSFRLVKRLKGAEQGVERITDRLRIRLHVAQLVERLVQLAVGIAPGVLVVRAELVLRVVPGLLELLELVARFLEVAALGDA